MFWYLVLFLYILFYIASLFYVYRHQSMSRWLPQYIMRVLPEKKDSDTHVLIMLGVILDFKTGKQLDEDETRRLVSWDKRMREVATQVTDSDNISPQYTWFIPLRSLNDRVLSTVAEWCYDGHGEAAMYFPFGDTVPSRFRQQYTYQLEKMSRYGGYIETHAGSDKRYSCGVAFDDLFPEDSKTSFWFSEERIDALVSSGCYADFTLPVVRARHPMNGSGPYYYMRQNNKKVYAVDPNLSMYQETLGSTEECPGLMLIPGNAGLNIFDWRDIFCPHVDTGLISGRMKPHHLRTHLLMKSAAPLPKRKDWRVIKLTVNASQYEDEECIVGKYADRIFDVCANYKKRKGTFIHFLTGRELCNIITAAASGCMGNPHRYRNFRYDYCLNRKLNSSLPCRVLSFSDTMLDVIAVQKEYWKLRCSFFIMSECSGTFSKLTVSVHTDQNSIETVIAGDGEILMDFMLRKPPVSVEGGQIVRLERLENGNHVLQIKFYLKGKKEVYIKT